MTDASAPLVSFEAERQCLQVMVEIFALEGPGALLTRLERLGLSAADFVAHALHGPVYAASERLARSGAKSINRVILTPLVEAAVGRKVKPEDLDAVITGDSSIPWDLGETLAERVRDLSSRREVIARAQEVVRAAHDQALTVADVQGRLAALASSVSVRGSKWQPLTVADAAALDEVNAVQDGRGTPRIDTGIDEWDLKAGGFPATLCVVAALEGVGKSALVATVLRNMALAGSTPAVFSMEDRAKWISYRHLALESGVRQTSLRYHRLNAAEWDAFGRGHQAVTEYHSRIFFDDRPRLTAQEVLSAARTAITRFGARSIWLDNMSSMAFPAAFGERSDVLRDEFLDRARALANETGVPFIVLSHLRSSANLNEHDMPNLRQCSETMGFSRFARYGVGICRVLDEKTKMVQTDVVRIGILKNTNGPAKFSFEVPFNSSAAMLGEPLGRENGELFGNES